MKKLLPLLMVIILVLCVTACSDSAQPSNVGGNSSNSVQTETEAHDLVQAWLDGHPFDKVVTIGDSLTSEDDSGFLFTLYQDEELAQIRVVKNNGALLRHNPENNQNISINDWYKSLDNYGATTDSDNSNPTPTPTTTPTPTEPTPSFTPSETPPTEVNEVGGEADGQGGDYDDDYYDSLAKWYYDGYYDDSEYYTTADFVTYVNDGFSLSMPSNAKISSEVEKETVNQFSISSGAEVPTEKIYKIEFIYGVADVKVQVNIFPNNGTYFSTTNINVPNADGAYLHENISDSILEISKYELKVIRGDLAYILETTYNPYVALMGQAKGQTDFSYERELLKELLNTFEAMINSFALTDNPVSFENIANSGTFWQESVTDLIR